MDANEITNVLILCTGNSARSIMAEAIMSRLGGGRFQAYSAGSAPKGEIHPLAAALLHERGHPTDALRSKSWEEFSGPGAPRLDFVFTVCDNAAGEACPIWPGHPMTVHWGIPDPAEVDGTEAERRQAFADAYNRLSDMFKVFVDFPLGSIDPSELRRRLEEIGRGSDG